MNTVLDEMIREMPAGLDRAILRVLSFHRGKSNAISRDDLLAQLKGYTKDERIMRACIQEIRKRGDPEISLICSMGGIGGGYYLADNHDEVMEYIDHEVDPRAFDLLEQSKALRTAAEKRWGRYSPEKQISLF